MAACGHDAKQAISVEAEPVRAASKWRPRVHAPGLRLPDTVEPLGYKLRLEIDPDSVTFRGHVDIRARVTKTTDVIWLHAKELDISRAQVRVGTAGSEALTVVPAKGDEMLGFTAGRTIFPSEITLAFEYTGRLRDDTNGLFRQQADKKWFVYSQGQAVFTRLYVPCFDEPRFKTPWQLSVVVPDGNVALSNAPAAVEQRLADGRKEITFQELGPLPSYLVAIAVGPFALVDGGQIGAKTPFRIAVWPSRVASVKHAAKRVSRMLSALEAYLDQPMPWPKLDFVAVPQFFGAMENTGLVTFESHILFDESEGEYGFARVTAHELVHQWFGNLVTPAWWDELWLSEAFASFLGDKIAELAGESKDPLLVQQLARAEALAADAKTPLPLRREVRGNSSVDDTFDEIAYQKGSSVLAMFEGFMEPETFRAALRTVIRTRANRTITTDELAAAVAQVEPAVADAVKSYAAHAGPPIVEVALRCDSPRVIATARDGAIVPVCVRYPGAGGPSRACAIVSARTEIPLAATTCPAWLAGNANGTGYYEIVPAPATDAKTTVDPRWSQLEKLLPAERMALGADTATALARGELPVRDALRLARSLFASKDPFARLGGLAVVRAIDPIVDDATRRTWEAWVRKRLPSSKSTTTADRELAMGAAALVPAPGGAKALDGIVALAKAKPEEHKRAMFSQLGVFGSATAPRLVALVLDPNVPTVAIMQSVFEQLERGESRVAAWRAVKAKLGEIMARISPQTARELVHATSALCDAVSRGEVQAAFEPRKSEILDGERTIAAALASIDRCIARAKAAGDLAAVLRAP